MRNLDKEGPFLPFPDPLRGGPLQTYFFHFSDPLRGGPLGFYKQREKVSSFRFFSARNLKN
jgi:hypothetical protein